MAAAPRPDRPSEVDEALAFLGALDAQAAAQDAVEDARAADQLAQAEIARTSWTDRVRALAGYAAQRIEVELPDGTVLTGTVDAVLSDGIHLTEAHTAWLIRASAVHSIVGLGVRTRSAGTIAARLGVASLLRDWAGEHTVVQIVSARGLREGTVIRLGADHLDLAEHERDEPTRIRRVRTIAMASIWAVRRW